MKGDVRRYQKERLLSFLSVLTLVAAVTAFLIAVVIGFYHLEVLSLPTWLVKLLHLPMRGGNEILPGDEGRIYEAFKTRKDDPDDGMTLIFDLSRSDLALVLQATPPIDAYTVRYETTLRGGQEESVREVTVWKSGKRRRAEVRDEQGILLDTVTEQEDGSLLCENAKSGEITVLPPKGGFTLESLTGLPSVTEFLTSDAVRDLNLSLLRTGEENIYLAEFRYSDVGLRETYYLSLEYGILLNAASENALGETVYTCRTLSLSRDAEEDVFS